MKRIVSALVAICTVFCMTGLLAINSVAADVSDYLKDIYKDEQLGQSIMYRLFVPEDYDESKEYPLVIFLHGAGEVDSKNEAQLTGAYSAAKRLIEDDYLQKYPCIILAPQCYGLGSWENAADVLMSLITSLTERYSIDKDRLYITGLSLGGFGTCYMLAAYPGVFAAAAPLCGSYIASSEGAKIYAQTPMWVFHGAHDPTVSVGMSRNAVAAIKKAGGKNIKYTEYPRADHNIWYTTYHIDELYEWMFAQRLGQEPVWVRTLDVFKDVTVEAWWYYEAVKYAYYENIFKGVSENEFGPNLKMTRAMFVTVLHRMEGTPDSSGVSNKFSDVPANAWYGDAVKWANREGLVYGTSQTEFAPDEPISREQLATMMYRYAEYCSLDTSGRASPADIVDWNDVSDYAKQAILWTVNEKIIEGRSTKQIVPKDSAKRSEVATIIKRFMDYKNK